MKKLIIIVTVSFGALSASQVDLEQLRVPGATEFEPAMIDSSILNGDDEIIFEAAPRDWEMVQIPEGAIQWPNSGESKSWLQNEYEAYGDYARNDNRMGYVKDALYALYYNNIKPYIDGTQKRRFGSEQSGAKFIIGDVDSDDESN